MEYYEQSRKKSCRRINFASATNPGGGFLRGSNAQEESLVRSSGLFPSLRSCPGFYAAHRRAGDPFYSDGIIHSPHCPVFRDHAGALLEEPYAVDFFTCAAPNYQRIRKETPAATEEVQGALNRRAEAILMLAAKMGVTHLLLGAWGCGVFACPPAWVAEAFHASIFQVFIPIHAKSVQSNPRIP